MAWRPYPSVRQSRGARRRSWMNRLRPMDRAVLALHIWLRTTEITSSSKIGDLGTASASACDYPRVGIARSEKIFHSWPVRIGGIAIRCEQVDAEFIPGTGRVGCTHACDALWKTVFDCAGPWLIRKSIAQDTSLIGRDYLIEHTSPASFAGDQGHGEIHQVEKRDEDAEDDIYPRLAHDLRACRR